MNSGFFDICQATRLEKVKFTAKNGKVLNFHIKRDDLVDSEISGNKWRKLKHNVHYAKQHGYAGIASFGGAFSNHIAALAAAGARYQIATLGFIRTHQLDLDNPTLANAQQQGMTLVPLDRNTYRRRHDADFITELQQTYPNYFFVPEGGSNELAGPGLAELAAELVKQHASTKKVDYITCAIGSGGTISGLMDAMPTQQFIGVPVVKDRELIAHLQHKYADRLTLLNVNELGGYGKFTPQLEAFCVDFFQQTAVPIEPVYTGKLFYALCNYLMTCDSPAPKVTAIHTGGLQGIRGLLYRRQIQPERWQPLLAPTAV